MPRLANLEFDYQILEAIRDGRLVVFAGAGVSMGPPSNLDSFFTLAEKVAHGTGLSPEQPLDRFLGTLQHKGVAVHERASQFLSPPTSEPNQLHRDLIRLFGSGDNIKVVTTNFDLHFEAAAEEVFGTRPESFCAPALPSGYNFQGVVHVHGALPKASSFVLTDSDFGRAYLTEGWARRFLLDVFRTYTVLFVGYRHSDVVMNYLARALPVDASAGRFALTETEGSWNLLGIRPIRFEVGEGADAFQQLYDGVAKLAERGARGTLRWQARMFELVGRTPPVDPELVDEIEQALRDVSTCRLFSSVARDAGWPTWLNSRKLLEALFLPGVISERDHLLAIWLAEHYAIEHPMVCIQLIAEHELCLNPLMWEAFGHAVGSRREKPIEAAALRQWVNVLVASAPQRIDYHVLVELGRRCESEGLHDCSLAIFLHMCRYRFELKEAFSWPDDEEGAEPRRYRAQCSFDVDHWSLNEFYERCIKLHLRELAGPLLLGTVHGFSQMHARLSTWSGKSNEWDSFSYRRSAIEWHEQDRYPGPADVVIDAMRDALESLAEHEPAQVDSWIDQLEGSAMPLLRRLAVHAVTVVPTRSSDARISWVLERIGVSSLPEHHEVHRLAALSYPAAKESTRLKLIDAIRAVDFEDADSRPGELTALRFQFDWLSWLLSASPECALVEAALVPIRERFPQWTVSEHPDLTHWMGSVDWVGERSPWSTEQLLAQPARDHVEALLAFRGDDFDGPSRGGMHSAVRGAVKEAAAWGFELMAELQSRELWSSDLWSALLYGFQEAQLDQRDWESLLSAIAEEELHLQNSRSIAELLFRFAKDGGNSFSSALLTKSDAVADRLWESLTPSDDEGYGENWLTQAINRPAGILLQYWLASLSLALTDKEGMDRQLPIQYRDRFALALQDFSPKGANARSVLASQVAYLFRLDEAWTREHLIPLFRDPDADVFAQVWHGFLAWGRLYPQLAAALQTAFIAALERPADLPHERSRLIEFYAAMCVFHIEDPLGELLPRLFQFGTISDRVTFASQIGYLLRQLGSESTTRLWQAWLSQYWRNRLQGIPARLEQAECRKMLEWIPSLGAHYPDAVELAIQMPSLLASESHALYDLRESPVVDQYPQETASLLIYLSANLPTYQVGFLSEVAGRLLDLPQELRRRLDESLARAGAL